MAPKHPEQDDDGDRESEEVGRLVLLFDERGGGEADDVRQLEDGRDHEQAERRQVGDEPLKLDHYSLKLCSVLLNKRFTDPKILQRFVK